MYKSVKVPYKVRADIYTNREILGEIIEIRGELLTVNFLLMMDNRGYLFTCSLPLSYCTETNRADFLRTSMHVLTSTGVSRDIHVLQRLL